MADLHGDQVRPQVKEEFPGTVLTPGIAVNRADEDKAITGYLFQMASSINNYRAKPPGDRNALTGTGPPEK
jgi:hypothetical protein